MRSIKSFVLPRLRRIANAQSVKECQQAVSDLKEGDEWKADTSEKFQNYVSKTQLPVYRVSDALKTKIKWKTNTQVNKRQGCKSVDLPFWKCSLKDLSLRQKYNC